MAAKKRLLATDYLVYLVVRVGVAVLQAIPWSWALALADALAWLAYRLDRRHREVARDNLRHAFPEKSPAEIDALVRATYRHMLTMFIEMVRLPREVNLRNAERRIGFITPEAFAHAATWATKGRPLIIVTGHFGNWEALSYATGLAGFRAHVIARRLDNPYLDRFIADFRKATGQKMLDKNTDFEKVIDVLERGGFIAALADQDAGPKGEFVPFFGRPASTFKSIALLSLRYNAPILVFGAARIGDRIMYRVYLEDEIDPREYADRPAAAREITARYTAALERMARRHPEQYFWLHRRWKHQPAERKKKAA